MTTRRLATFAATLALLGAALALAPGVSASQSAAWAPADSATIHPGTQTVTASGQCTANFIFSDGSNVYIGQAAHCSSTGAATDTNGCESASLPLETPVQIDGASQPGIMVYNSWLTMQSVGETDPDACAYNDFALVQIHPDDVAKVNPSIPVWGGPAGIAGPTAFGDQVFSFGNSSLRLGLESLSPKYGLSLGTAGGGWTHPLYTLTPGIPGDSGSPFVDASGAALGVLSTLSIAPLPLANNVSDIGHMLAYANAHSPLNVQLVNGTEPFNPDPINGLVGGALAGLGL